MERRPSWRVTFYWTRRFAYAAFILTILVILFYALDVYFDLWNGLVIGNYENAKLFIYAMVALLIIPDFLWNWLVWWTTVYSMTSKQFILKKGVFNRKKYLVNYENIQNINIEKNFLETAIMLSTIRIETSGTTPGESELVLEGISSKDSERLVKEISHMSDAAKEKSNEGGKPPGYGSEIAELKKRQEELLTEIRELKSYLSKEKRDKGWASERD